MKSGFFLENILGEYFITMSINNAIDFISKDSAKHRRKSCVSDVSILALTVLPGLNDSP